MSRIPRSNENIRHHRSMATRMVSVLNRREALGQGDIFTGITNATAKNKRRAKNRVAAKSRRMNRGK